MVLRSDKTVEAAIRARMRMLSGAAALLCAAVAVLVLVGWVFDLTLLKSFSPSLASMKANTAASLLTASAALWLLRHRTRRPWMSGLAYALAAFTLLVGAATLLEYLTHADLGIDQLLFADPHPGAGTAWPGRMGINTAVCLSLIGAGLLLMDVQGKGRGYALQLPVLSAWIIALGALIGYVEDVEAFYRIASYSGMALHTSISLFLLSTGILFARSETGYSALISQANPGSALVRRLLPLAVGIPMVLDWFRLRGEQAGWYGEEGGLVVFLVMNIICMIAFINLAIVPLNALLAQLRRSQDEVMREKGTLDAILESADHSVISADVDGVIVTFNAAAQRWLGYSEGEVVGKQTPLAFHDAHEVTQRAKQLSAELQRTVEPGFDVFVAKARIGLPDEHEWTYVRKDGSGFPVSLSVTALRDAEGAIAGFVGIASDITARREVERLKNEFISTVSHELRTPLTSIRGALALLEGGMVEGVAAQARSLVHIAYNNCERLIRLINDILDVEKISAGKMAFDLRPVALDTLVEGSLVANQSYADQHQVRFEFSNDAPGSQVSVDSDRLSQVMNNLLSNAAKFSPAGAVVDVRVHPGPRGVRVSVADRGPGVPDDFRDRVFGRFAQADASDRRRTGGTGLGLSICKAIVERMDGSIGFEARPGGGSVFYFDLPLVNPDAAAFRRRPPPRPRVLVCEDDADAARQLVEILSADGFHADIAPDARSARRRLAESRYDAMTLDILLPGEDGLSLLAGLRADPATAALPVVVVSISGRDEVAGTLNGGTLTALDWLRKPVDRGRLLTALRQALPADGRARPRILHVEDDADLRAVVAGALAGEADVEPASNLADARAHLEKGGFDLMILDLMLPDGSGDRLLEELGEYLARLPVLIFSAYDPGPALAARVAGVLAKTRTTNAELVQTIRALIRRSEPAREEADA